MKNSEDIVSGCDVWNSDDIMSCDVWNSDDIVLCDLTPSQTAIDSVVSEDRRSSSDVESASE